MGRVVCCGQAFGAMNLVTRVSNRDDFPLSCSVVHIIWICVLSTTLQPRECMRYAKVNNLKCLEQSFADLKCQNILGLGEMKSAENVLGPRRGGLPV